MKLIEKLIFLNVIIVVFKISPHFEIKLLWIAVNSSEEAHGTGY